MVTKQVRKWWTPALLHRFNIYLEPDGHPRIKMVGYQLDDEPNLYMKSGCFTKHPLRNGWPWSSRYVNSLLRQAKKKKHEFISAMSPRQNQVLDHDLLVFHPPVLPPGGSWCLKFLFFHRLLPYAVRFFPTFSSIDTVCFPGSEALELGRPHFRWHHP